MKKHLLWYSLCLLSIAGMGSLPREIIPPDIANLLQTHTATACNSVIAPLPGFAAALQWRTAVPRVAGFNMKRSCDGLLYEKIESRPCDNGAFVFQHYDKRVFP